MKFSPEIRKAIYTTNDESAMKLIFMILQRISKRWTMPIRDWGEALNQFTVIYGDRVPL
jgi:transposase-like protein